MAIWEAHKLQVYTWETRHCDISYQSNELEAGQTVSTRNPKVAVLLKFHEC